MSGCGRVPIKLYLQTQVAVQKGQVRSDRKWIAGCQGLGRDCLMGYEVSIWGDEKVEVQIGSVVARCECPESHRVVRFKRVKSVNFMLTKQVACACRP